MEHSPAGLPIPYTRNIKERGIACPSHGNNWHGTGEKDLADCSRLLDCYSHPGLLVDRGQAVLWNTDLETGLKWRKVTGDELERSPWPNQTVNVFRNYGNLSDFEDQAEVTLNMAANGTVFDVTFHFQYDTNRTVWQTDVLHNGTNETAPALNQSGTVNIRVYTGNGSEGNRTWFAGRVFGQFANGGEVDGFYATGIGPDANVVTVLQNQSNFRLDAKDKDLISLVNRTCAYQSGGSDGGGGDVNLDTSTDSVNTSETLCAGAMQWNASLEAPCNGVVVNCSKSVQGDRNAHRFFYAGEVEWCDERGYDNWINSVENRLQESRDVFENTDVRPVFGGTTCWFYDDRVWMTNRDKIGSTMHDDTFCHNHGSSVCGHGPISTHWYPYNPVWKSADTIFENHHDISDYIKHAKDDWRHLNEHLQAWPKPSKFQILHTVAEVEDPGDPGGKISYTHGKGDTPGVKSVASHHISPCDERCRDPGGLVSPHEFGHNFGGTHPDSVCTQDGITVMGNDKMADQKGCQQYKRYPKFSFTNRQKVNDNA